MPATFHYQTIMCGKLERILDDIPSYSIEVRHPFETYGQTFSSVSFHFIIAMHISNSR
jgi:hypothetical protein